MSIVGALELISITIFIVGLFNLFLTLQLFTQLLRGNRAVLHLTIGIAFTTAYCFFVALTYFLASGGLEYALTYRLCWIGFLTIPSFFHLSFSYRRAPSPWTRWVAPSLYLFWIVIMFFLVMTDHIEIAPPSLIPYQEVVAPWEIAIRGFAALQLLWVIWESIRSFRLAEGVKRLRAGYLLLGLSLYCFCGIVTATVAQFAFGLQVDPALASLFSLGFAIPLSYSMTHQRLFNLKSVFIRMAIASAITAGIGVIHFSLFHWLLQVTDVSWALFLTAIFLGLLLFFSPMFISIRNLIIRFMDPGSDSVQNFLGRLSRLTTSSSGVDELIRSASKLVRESLKCQAVSFYLLEGHTLWLRHRLSHDGAVVPTSPSTRSLPASEISPQTPILVREEQFLDGASDSEVPAIFQSFESISPTEVIVPLALKDNLIGVLSIGKKVDFGAYTQSDFVMLDTLRSQLALAAEGARLLSAAVSDGLTGLYHQTYFKARLGSEIARARRQRSKFSTLLFDVDYFKKINDSFGHLEGDRVLQRLAELMRQCFRAEDVLCRYGGEEFAVLLIEGTSESLLATAERFRSLVENTEFSKRYQITVSIGACAFDGQRPGIGTTDSSEILGQVDAALYQAKNSGRNRVVLVPEVLPAVTPDVDS